jgi:hypothetical protein
LAAMNWFTRLINHPQQTIAHLGLQPTLVPITIPSAPE